MSDYTLGAHPSPDDERDYPLAAVMEVPATLPPSYIVPPAIVYNQGSKPYCVGYSGAGERTFTERPEAGMAVLFDADELYAQCKRIDGIAGDGSTVRASVTVQLNTGVIARSGPHSGQRLKIASYARCIGRDQIKAAIVAGGCNVALRWPSNWMSNPGSAMLPTPSAASAGGHATLLVGYDDARGYLLQNSWGASWGVSGRVWVAYADLEPLLWEAWKTVDAPDPSNAPTLTVTAFAKPRRFVIPAGTVLHGYDPARPNQVLGPKGRWGINSSAHADAEVSVAWSITPSPVPTGGPFLRVVDGVYAGLLIVEAAVRLDPA